MIIKPIKIADLEMMANIEMENFKDAWDYKTLYYEVIKNENSIFLGAYLCDELIGYLGFWMVVDNIDIINLAVKNKHKRSGVATMLFSDLNVISKALKVKTITLEVNVNNLAAINLYKQQGFKILRKIKDYYQKSKDDAYLMQKEVGHA